MPLPRPEDRAAIIAVLRDPAEDDTIRNHAANILRNAGYERLTVELRGILENSVESSKFRGWAMQHLGVAWLDAVRTQASDALSLRDFLVAKVTDRDASVRREAVLALCRGSDPAGFAAVHAWFDDPAQKAMLDLAVRLAGENNLRDCLPSIRRLAASEEDDGVRIAAIRVLAQWRDQESRSVIAAAQKAKTTRVQKVAAAALSVLNGAVFDDAWKDLP